MADAVRLSDLESIPRPGSEGAGSFEEFLDLPLVARLGWPADVARDWLWEHGKNGPFLIDYAGVDLAGISWTLEEHPTARLIELPTGPHDGDLIDHISRDHRHWVRVRGAEVGAGWSEHGTWLRHPILIDRALVAPGAVGFQVVEGRTRVGILRGRVRDGLRVADGHWVWVGRAHP